MPGLIRLGLARVHRWAVFPLRAAHKGTNSAASRGAYAAFVCVSRDRSWEQLKSRGYVPSQHRVKLFYMQFAQMEMRMEVAPACQGGISRPSLFMPCFFYLANISVALHRWQMERRC